MRSPRPAGTSMMPGTDAAIVAAVARLEEAVSGVKDIVIEMRAENKERRSETARSLEVLDTKVDGLAVRLQESERKDTDSATALRLLALEVEELKGEVNDIRPHIDRIKTDKEERNDRRGTFWRPMWVGITAGSLASIVLVFGEAIWSFINSHFLHWG